jgi:hypothetical protein
MDTLFYFLILAILIESITQIITKSVITESVRAYIISKNPTGKVSYLLTCGYCSSFWVTLKLVLVSYLVSTPPVIVNNYIINFVILVLLCHRFSNIFHGAIDKYFDKRYDIRYNKVD